jgi:cholesterol transport system auxiliary component
MKPFRRLALLVSLISIAAGCLAHREHRHIYTLDAALEARTQGGSITERPVLELERVLVPDYLDTTDIQWRVGSHEIHESATGRFGERLSLGITHALQADLAVRLPLNTIVLSQSVDGPARRILVTVEAFDVSPTASCVLVADWSILDADRRRLLSADRGTFTVSGAGDRRDDGAMVEAMADAVRKLAERIASSVETLPTRESEKAGSR